MTPGSRACCADRYGMVNPPRSSRSGGAGHRSQPALGPPTQHLGNHAHGSDVTLQALTAGHGDAAGGLGRSHAGAAPRPELGIDGPPGAGQDAIRRGHRGQVGTVTDFTSSAGMAVVTFATGRLPAGDPPAGGPRPQAGAVGSACHTAANHRRAASRPVCPPSLRIRQPDRPCPLSAWTPAPTIHRLTSHPCLSRPLPPRAPRP
jgi:hypothetical protein